MDNLMSIRFTSKKNRFPKVAFLKAFQDPPHSLLMIVRGRVNLKKGVFDGSDKGISKKSF